MLNVVLIKVPPQYTFVCQPADISWNKPLKDGLRRRWVEQLQGQVGQHQRCAASRDQEGTTSDSGQSGERGALAVEGPRRSCASQDEDSVSDSTNDRSVTTHKRARRRRNHGQGFELTPPARGDIATWIAEEWAGLSSSTISGGFKRISLLLDTRNVEAPAPETLDSVHALLASMEELAIMTRATAHVCSDDDIHTANESGDSSEEEYC